jgi:hypothetical protein
MTIKVSVLNNIREFLQRVDMKGMEAFAYAEAFTAIQNEIALQQSPGIAGLIAGAPIPGQTPPAAVPPPGAKTSEA